jgi:hypothetical protein
MKNIRISERGAAHVIAIVVFVLLLGAVGFVGYNAWQKQSTNAGGKNTVGSNYDAAKPATYRYGANNLCRMYHTVNAKVQVAKDQETVIEIMSNNSKILSVNMAKLKPGTHYLKSSDYTGSLDNATVKYVVKEKKTVIIDGKGKKKSTTKVTWSENASAVLVADLPRCVPTDDMSEFNFYGGGKDGLTNACTNNGEIVFRYAFSEKPVASTKPRFVAEVDGKIIKEASIVGNKPMQPYYNRIPAKGKQFTLYYTDNAKYKGKKDIIVNRPISSIKSCL